MDKTSKCTKRNPEPPCSDGFYEKKNKNGQVCCYKNRPKKAREKKKATEKEKLAKIRAEAEAKRKETEKKKKEFDEAMQASREARTNDADIHEKTIDNILHVPQRKLELAKMKLHELKSLGEGYTENTSELEDGFRVKGNITKNELIERIYEFEKSIDTNPELLVAKKTRKNHTQNGGKRKRRRKHTRKRRRKHTRKHR